MNGLTCNMKSSASGKYERSEEDVLCIVGQNYERPVVAIDHFRNFKSI